MKMKKEMKQEELLEKLTEQGIAAVAEYIEERFQKKILIVDSYGYEHFPEKSRFIKDDVVALFADIAMFEESHYYYRKTERMLLYPVGSSSLKVIVVVKNVSEEQINSVLTVLNEVKLALKLYINYEKRLYENVDKISESLIADIFVKPSLNIKLILEKAGIELDMNRKYAVLLIKVSDDEENKINQHILWADIASHAQRLKLSFIPPVAWNGVYVSFLSGRYDPQTLEVREDWISAEISRIWQKGFEEKHGVKLGIAVGQPQPLRDLHRSYNEARVAMYFHLLKEEHSFVELFANLGVFAVLFSQDPAVLKDYCMKTINKVLEYDHDYEGDLCTTLRALLEYNFNWKAVSEVLYVHVNTLRYRYEKIEQILAIDLSKAEVRSDLFVALRTADILREMGYLQPVFIGNTKEKSKVTNIKKQSKTLW